MTFTDCNLLLGNYNNAYADNLSFTVGADIARAGRRPRHRCRRSANSITCSWSYLENKGYTDIVGSPNAPYLNSIINAYGLGSNYYALTHPSDPNYYPIIGGTDFGINYNCAANCFDATNLADNIEAAGKTWAGYADGGGGYTTPTDRLPFLAFGDIYNDPARVATHLFDLTQLGSDLDVPEDAPNFAWFAADDATNMEGPTDTLEGVVRWALSQLTTHQYNVAAGDEWLQETLPVILDSPTWQDTSQQERHLHHVRRGLRQHLPRDRQPRQSHCHSGHSVAGGGQRRDATRPLRRGRPQQSLQLAAHHRRVPRSPAADQQRQVCPTHERVLGVVTA